MYEYHNRNRHAVQCTIPPHGTILVPADSCVPTPKQEAHGLTADVFETFTPALLKPTVPAVRRRLLEAEGLEVPEDVVAATSHLEEFARVEGPGNSGSGEAAPVLPQEISDDEIVRITDEGTSVEKNPSPSVAPPPPPPPAETVAAKAKALDEAPRSHGAKLGEDLQEVADALSSSPKTRGKKIENPD